MLLRCSLRRHKSYRKSLYRHQYLQVVIVLHRQSGKISKKFH
ncbi:Uncharacterized protein BM_BM700 [Brugia malayi]|uniref:Uncharacterized protein n=1 Tax=Brugia malayi TaxID=6279 RepID=A0A5K1TXH7_BRUMA|nr:Uncharacterized protein BM_BM700 [Brugia malayi]VIO86639.1 Uncharacterized protein BM_BM700 [Brugia malayi]